MKALLSNRTYQIIAGSAFFVMLFLLYITNTSSEDTSPDAATNVTTSSVETSNVNKVETTTVASDNNSENSEKIETTR